MLVVLLVQSACGMTCPCCRSGLPRVLHDPGWPRTGCQRVDHPPDSCRADRLGSAELPRLRRGAAVFHRHRDIGKSTVATARRPVLVISTRPTSITRLSSRTNSSGVTVARPARTDAVIVLRVKP